MKKSKNKIIVLIQEHSSIRAPGETRRETEIKARNNSVLFECFHQVPISSHSNSINRSVTVYSFNNITVDTETNRIFKDKLTQKVFHEDERSLLHLNYTDLWCIKEAHIKKYDLKLLDVMNSNCRCINFDEHLYTTNSNKIIATNFLDKSSCALLTENKEVHYQIYTYDSHKFKKISSGIA